MYNEFSFHVRFSFLHHLLECFRGEALWPLNGEAKGAVPDEGAEDAESSGDAKQNSVVTHLCHSIVLQGGEQAAVYYVTLDPKIMQAIYYNH